jgi:hypothetical protein
MTIKSRAVDVEAGPSLELSSELHARIDREVEAGRVLRISAEGGSQLYVPFGGGRAVPLMFTYEGSGRFHWQMTVEVLDGRPRCTRLILDSAPGAFIDAAALRALPFGRLLEEALLVSAIELDDDGRPVGQPIGTRTTSVADARRLHAKIEREHRRRARGTRTRGRVDDERLKEVAEVYRGALARGSPTEAVHKSFKIGRSTASRWVRMARDRGYLGESPGKGRPGEKGEA